MQHDAMQHEPTTRPILAREKLDFQLDERIPIPRFWNGGNPYKRRFFDAMALPFSIGKRHCMSSVRAYRDQVTDLRLLQEVKDFTRQEAQHGIVHTQFNEVLEKQDLNVAWTQRFLGRKFKWQLSRWSAAFNLSHTAAAEPLTALMRTTFMARPDIIAPFGLRIRAMYTWHALEEVEHKDVCFDVLTKVAKAGYCTRIAGLVNFSIEYPIGNWYMVNHMLKDDGFGV